MRMRSSILMTSAPKSARSRVAIEPTPIQQKSATRTPARGPRRARTDCSSCAWPLVLADVMRLSVPASPRPVREPSRAHPPWDKETTSPARCQPIPYDDLEESGVEAASVRAAAARPPYHGRVDTPTRYEWPHAT